MGILIDLALAVPIGVIYNMIIHESAEIFNSKLNYKDKIQRNLLLIFGGGLIGFLIATFLTTNPALKYGMYLGSILLLAHSIMYNWVVMQNDTRIIVMMLSLIVLIWYAYSHDDGNRDSAISSDYKEKDGMKISSLLPMTFTQYEQYSSKHEHFNDDNDEDE